MIGKLLGHTQVQTTARYAHLARDSIQTAAARITGSINGNLMGEEAESTTQRKELTGRNREPETEPAIHGRLS